LVINKTDLAEAVGADLAVMDRDSKKMRGTGPIVFAQVKHKIGIEEISQHVRNAWQASAATS
jgi:urease accessory protein